jgi:hypothetical protein
MARRTKMVATAEVLPGPSDPGSVTAEIGGNRGAVVVHVPADWAGREIEIRRVPDTWDGTHVAVLARHLSQGEDHSAFFPSVGQGVYELRPLHPHGPDGHRLAGSEVRTVTVAGGEITDIMW